MAEDVETEDKEKLERNLGRAWAMTYNPAINVERAKQIQKWGEQFRAAAGRFASTVRSIWNNSPDMIPWAD